MRQTVRTRLVLAALIVAGAVAFSVSPAGAQFASRVVEVTGLGGGPVTIAAADGGVEVVIPGRVMADVSTGPGVYLAVAGDNTGARLVVEASGIGGGAVQTALTMASLSALNGRICTPGGQGKVGVDGIVRAIPPLPGDGGTGAQVGRTSISISYPNQAGSGFIACFASALDGGTSPVCNLPDAGFLSDGWPVEEGGSAELEVSAAWVLRCRACNSDGTTKGSTAGDRVSVGFIEQDCDQFQ